MIQRSSPRLGAGERRRTSRQRRPEGVEVRELTLSVGGASVPARIYRPVNERSRAALVWMHGGAFMMGSLPMGESDAVSRAFARRGLVVVSVGYRLVPPVPGARRWRGEEAVRFPLPLDDCLAAWSYLRDQPDAKGLPLFIGGASAGGNLAVMSTLRARAAGREPPDGVLLAYPLLHADLPAPAGISERVASACVRLLARCFVGSADPARLSEAFPKVLTLAGFPPTIIVTGARDIVRWSGDRFADDLERHGVDVELRHPRRTIHGHLNRPARPAFERTMESFAAWLETQGV